MAVEAELLGRSVRCPHCRGVVAAPAAGAPPFSALSEDLLDPAAIGIALDEDSIFAPPSEDADELFGDLDRPRVELPPELAPAAELQADPALEELLLPGPADALWPSAPEEAAASPPFPARSPPTEPPLLPTTPASPPHGPRAGTGFGMILLIFLIPYAILATAAAVYYYVQWKQTPHPLELLPDWPGDTPGATHKDATSQVYERVLPDTPLPDKLKVRLGQALTVGDLEVTPIKVEQRRLVFRFAKTAYKPEPSPTAALVLTVQLANRSRDVVFVPTDAAFNPLWKEGAPKPYSFLEIGPHRYYGGAVVWKSRGRRGDYRDADPREYIEGQEEDQKVLAPGTARRAIFCTNPEDPEVLRDVRHFSGICLWRIRLRHGLVAYGEREIAVSAVVGVEFDPSAIQQVSGEPSRPH